MSLLISSFVLKLYVRNEKISVFVTSNKILWLCYFNN